MSWSGRKVTEARARWRPRLPLPCYRCGRPVHVDPTKLHEGWTVEHVQRRMDGGALGLENQWVAHTGCNSGDGGRAGGARGAAKTNARRATTSANRLERYPLSW